MSLLSLFYLLTFFITSFFLPFPVFSLVAPLISFSSSAFLSLTFLLSRVLFFCNLLISLLSFSVVLFYYSPFLSCPPCRLFYSPEVLLSSSFIKFIATFPISSFSFTISHYSLFLSSVLATLQGRMEHLVHAQWR